MIIIMHIVLYGPEPTGVSFVYAPKFVATGHPVLRTSNSKLQTRIYLGLQSSTPE